MDYINLALLCFFAQLAAHYLPISKLFGHKLHPVFNYVIGVSIIAGATTDWVLSYPVRPLAALWLAICASGLAVVGAYMLDSWTDYQARAEDAEEQVNLLERQE